MKEENVTSHNILCYGKMENNFHLSNKKAIFYNMKVYYEAKSEIKKIKISDLFLDEIFLLFRIKEKLSDK